MTPEDKVKVATETYTLLYKGEKASSYTEKQKRYHFKGSIDHYKH